MPVATATGGPLVRVDASVVRDMLTGVFRAVDLPAADAAAAADALVAAELRGVVTHGVANLAPRYVHWVEEGFANARPVWRVTRGSTGLINVDGDRGLGVVVAARVMDEVMDRASQTGIAMATVHNSRHLGMAAYHAMLALERGMIGICTTAVRASMVPTFGREARLGTNPIAVAVPAGEEPAFVFDAAMTTVASNKLRLRSNAGEVAPPGWMVNADGVPVPEAVIPVEPFRLTPLGGTPEGSSHKGYGLAMVVDILSTTLSQATFGMRFGQGEASHNMTAIDIDAVMPIAEFRSAMDEYLRTLKATPPAVGHDRVLVAGELEHESCQRHLLEGIPLPTAAVEWLVSSADRFGVPQGRLEVSLADARAQDN